MKAQTMICGALLAALLLPAGAFAQESGGMPPAREALRAAGFDLPTPAEREAVASRDRRVQRLWSTALIGAGGALGAVVGFSHNEWAFDEGWVGVGIAGTALGFGLFGIFDPMSWAEVEVSPQGLVSRRPYGAGSGLARGASLSLRW